MQTAVILAGGKGTRLHPLTTTIPKPLLPLGNYPIIEVVIRQLAAAGYERIVVTLGYMSQLFAACIGDGSQWGVSVQYSLEHEPLGTAAPLRLIADLPENFLVMNGDLLTTLDFADFNRFHTSRSAAATIAVSKREVKIDYGVIRSDENSALSAYEEKPIIRYEVSMGINLLSRAGLELIPANTRFDMPDLMLALKQAGRSVLCYPTDAYWQDIGRLDDYHRAGEDFLQSPERFLPDLAATSSPIDG